MKRIVKMSLLLTATASLLIVTFDNCYGLFGSQDSGSKSSLTIAGNPFIDPEKIASLPRIILNSSYPTLANGHRILTVGRNRDYQNCQPAIDAASPGDEVVIDAGFTCTPVVLRNKGNSQNYIVIRTADLGQISPDGTRLSPTTDSPHLANIETTLTAPAITTEPGANFYYVDGLNLSLRPDVSTFAISIVRLGSGEETDVIQLPHDLVFSHCWVHASSQQETKRGVSLNASRVSVVDSIIEQIQMSTSLSNAIGGWNTGVGPFKIVNNDISASGNNFELGGSTVTIQGEIPSDIEFRQNHIYKLSQWQNGPYQLGTFVYLTNGQRILFDGNVFENNWQQSLVNHASAGFAMALQPLSYSTSQGPEAPGTMPWVRVQDINFNNNIVRNTDNGFDIAMSDPQFSEVVSQRLAFGNNAIYQIGNSSITTNGIILLHENGPGPTAFYNNTMLSIPQSTSNLIQAENTSAVSQFYFGNNITYNGGGGVHSPAYGTGAATLNAYFPGVYFQGNALAGQDPNNYGSYAQLNTFPSNMTAIGFLVDPTNGVSNYQNLALSPTSSTPPICGVNIQILASSLGGQF